VVEKMAEKKITLILGKRGTGKSYLANKLIQSERRLLIYDTLSEYETGVIFDTEHAEQFKEYWRHVYRRNFRLIYRPLNPEAEIDEIAELVFALGDMTLLVEEVDCYCTSYQISDAFAHIVQRGRHKNISLIGVTQRPFGIHRLLTSQAKEIYVFGTNEPRDRDYLKLLLGEQIEAKLDQLKQYEYVRWQEGKQELEIGKA
jgi:DNA helicase HerA-like ATPase